MFFVMLKYNYKLYIVLWGSGTLGIYVFYFKNKNFFLNEKKISQAIMLTWVTIKGVSGWKQTKTDDTA